jgi:hypothetical protein
MTIRKLTVAAGLAGFVLVCAAACGGVGDPQSSQRVEQPSAEQSSSQSTETKKRPRVDAAVVRGMTDYDYERVTSLAALARMAPSVTLGTVVGWTDGRSRVEKNGSGYVDTSLFAVLEIKVLNSYRALDGRGGDRVYVEVPRGGEVRVDGKLPEGTKPVLATIDELNSAVPRGTRVIVVGRAAPTATELEKQTPGSTVHNVAAGHPQGTGLLRAHVQGLIFEDEQGNFVSGLADEEKEWGWVPSAKSAAGGGFSHLTDQLDALGR